MFTSGTQTLQGRKVNHDTEPYMWGDGSRETEKFVEENPSVGLYVEHKPRPEFDVTDNPVLAAFRENLSYSLGGTPKLAAEWLESFAPHWHVWRHGRIPARAAHRHHAKQVFAHLAALG